MTINTALNWALKKIEKKYPNSASLDAEILLSFVFKRPKEFLYTYPEKKLNFLQKLKLAKLIKKRLDNFPIAYLTHQKEFYDYNFFVNKHVLVPRPLTEQMVDLALREIKKRHSSLVTRHTICDVGTGSGNIIISLAKELQKKYSIDDFKLYGLDISGKALKVAKKNAKLNKVDKHITFLKSDLLNTVVDKQIDLILANLPYLEADDLKEQSITKEPKLALVGDYQKLFKQIDSLKNKPIVIYEDKNGINLKSLK